MSEEKNKLYVIRQIEYQNIDYQVSSVDISQIREAGILDGMAYEEMNDEELLTHFQENSSALDEFIPLFDESPEILEDNMKLHSTNSLDPHSVGTSGYLDESQLVNDFFAKLDTHQICQMLGNDMELFSKTREELLSICKEKLLS
jgi:hypothetical protein